MRSSRGRLGVLALLIVLAPLRALRAASFTHQTFADFSSGTWAGWGSSITAAGGGGVQLGYGGAELLSVVTSTPLPTTQGNGGAAVWNGRIYVSGGKDVSELDTVRSAAINADGSMGTWRTETALPLLVRDHGMTAWNGRLYIAGGYDGGCKNSVYSAPIHADGTLGNWVAEFNLPTARNGVPLVPWNGRLYALGGSLNCGSIDGIVYSAQVSAAGTLGAWRTEAQSIPAGGNAWRGLAYNGRLYSLGGITNAGDGVAVYSAPVAADGVVGAWVAEPSYPTNRASAGVAVWNGRIFAVGGRNTTPVLYSVVSASISANGRLGPWITENVGVPTAYFFQAGAWNGTLVAVSLNTDGAVYTFPINDSGYAGDAWTTNAISLPGTWDMHDTQVWNGAMHVLGGHNAPVGQGVAVASAIVAGINPDGSVGPWSRTSDIPLDVADFWDRHNGVAVNGWSYEFDPPKLIHAQFTSTGGFASAWTQGIPPYPAPSTINGFEIVSVSSALYVMGGSDDFCNPIAGVKYAFVAATGTLATEWRTTSPLPTNRYFGAATAWNGYLYYLGGRPFGCNPATANNVYYAFISADGSVDLWDETTALPANLEYAHVEVWDGSMYVFGGVKTEPDAVNTVYRAAINPDGTLGAWVTMTPLPAGRANVYGGRNSTKWRGRLYQVGGNNGAANEGTDTIFYSGVSSFSAAGTYFNVMDLGADYLLSSLSWNATLNGGALTVSMSTASSASEFSPWVAVTNGAALPQSWARYVQYRVDLTPSDVNATPVLNSMTVSVDTEVPSGCDSILRVGSGNTYTTIQAAVDSVSDIDNNICIVVREAGTYAESVQVRGKTTHPLTRLRIMAAPTLPAGSVIVAPSAGSAAFDLQNDSVTLEGLRIEPSGAVAYGVRSTSASVRLSSVTVEGLGYVSVAGIWISSRSAIERSSVTVAAADAVGLLISGSSNAVWDSSVTYNNAAGSAGAAVRIIDGGYNRVERSTITSHYDDTPCCSYAPAFDLVRASWNVLSNLRVSAPKGMAIRLGAGSNYNTLERSTYAVGGIQAAMLVLSSSNTLTRLFMDNPTRGIWMGNSSGYNTVSLSTVNADGGLEAVGLWGSQGHAILDSYIRAGSAFGVRMSGGSAHTVLRSMISSGGSSAVRIESGSRHNRVAQSTVTSTSIGAAAYHVRGSSWNILEASSISASGHGVLFDAGAAGNLVLGSTIAAGGAGHAVFVAVDASSTTITGSLLRGFGEGVLRIESAAATLVSSSTVLGLGSQAVVYVESATFVTVDASTIASSMATGDSALVLAYSSAALIQGSYLQAAGGVRVVASTATVVRASTLVALEAAGRHAVYWGNGSVGLEVRGNELRSEPAGAGVGFSGGIEGPFNSGRVWIASNVIRGAHVGISVSTMGAGSEVWVESNTVLPSLVDTGYEVFGIVFDGLRTGATVQNNDVYYRSAGALPGRLVCGICGKSSGGLAIRRNRISNPDMLTAGRFYGIGFSETVGLDIAFNDVHLDAHSGVLSEALLIAVTDGVSGARLRHNVLASSMTVSGSSAAISVSAGGQANFDSQYNAFFSSNEAVSFYWGGAPQSLAQWRSIGAPAGLDSTSIVTPPRWVSTAPGAEDFHPRSQAGRYAAGSLVGGDAVTAGTLDAGDTAYGAGSENAPNGGRVNLGSYGGTAEASLTPPAPTAPVIAAVYSSSVTVSWGAVGSEGYWLDGSPQADFSAGVVSSATGNGALDRLTLDGLPMNTTYYFRAAARWGDFWSASAVQLSTATLVAQPAAIFPESARFTGVSTGSFTVYWDPGGNGAGTRYVIRASSSPNDSGPPVSVQLSTESWGAPAAGLGSLQANATYFVYAAAMNRAGALTDFVLAGATQTLLAPPAALPLRGVSPFGVVAAWSSVARGGELQGWRSLTPLPVETQGLAAAIVAGRVYVTGGSSGSGASAAAWQAAAQADGSLGPWAAASPLPAPRDSHAMAAWGGRLYVAGGADGAAQATVWSAPVLADGSLGPWMTLRPLPQPRMKLALVAHEGWLYAVGGDNGIFPQSTVYAAHIEADGSLGPWSAAANALAPARSGHAAAVVGGRLYVSGGVGGALEASVAYATLTDGLVGAWTAGRAMPAGRTRHALAAGTERLYVAGGHDGNAAVATVWSAAVSPAGGVGTWVEHASLPEARFLAAAVMTGERLYSLGGSDGAAAKSAVWLSSATGTEYLVERSLVDTFAPVAEDSGWFHGQSYEFAGLTPNTTQYFRVSVRSGAGAVGATVPLGSTMTWAAVPGNALSTFTAVEISSIGVQWTLGANPAGTEFRCQASTAPDLSGAVEASSWGSFTSVLFNGLSLNTSYYLRVQGRNALGVEGSPLFLGAAFTLSSAPVSSTITAVQAAGFTLEWSTGNLPAWTRYEAQASTMADFVPIAASTVTVSSMTTFSGLPSAATFYARVRSVNGNGVPSLFDVVVTTRTGLDATPPSAPTGVAGAPAGTPDAVLVRWTAPGDDGAVGDLPPGSKFLIQWSAKPDAETAWASGSAQLTIDTGPVAAGSGVSAVLSGLPSQSTVSFRVWARDEAGNLSPPSAAATAFASPFAFTRLDGAAADVGQSPSIAVDRFGNVHLAYRTASGELRYLKRAGGAWGAAQTPDPGVVAAEVAVAVDNDGNPQIAYRDAGVGRIKVARFSGSWSVSIVEAGDFRLGGLVLDVEGNARLSYGDPAAPAVKVASWTSVGWSTGVAGATSVTLSALSLDPAQRAAVVYGNAGGVQYAMGPSWAGGTVDPGISVASRPAVQVDSNGALWLAYADAGSSKLRAGRYVPGGGSAIVPVDEAATSGGLALDGAGRPVVAYWNAQDKALKYARFDGAAWSTGTVDSAGDVGQAAAIAIDGAGSVLIAYYDTPQGDLKFAEWAGGVAPAAGGNAAGRAMAPSAMAGLAVSQYQIQWTWTDNAAGELGFALYGSQFSSGPFSLIVDSVTLRASPGTGGTVSYIESGLTTGATYYRYAVVVTSGGVAASRLASTFPFNTVDASSPTIANHQAGDARWRRAATGLYDVDFADVGGTHLTKFQVRASTVAGGAGPPIVPYTDVVTAIGADAFANDWPLPPDVFNALWEDATNYISVKVFDGNDNSAEQVDAFYVLKDTSPPTFVNRQAGSDPTFRGVAGTVYDVDAVDKVSRLAAFQYSVSTRPVSADGGVRPWTDIALVGGATDYTPDWGVAFAALPSDVTSYVSVRAWDVAGGTATLLDAFHIRKDTAGPVVRIAFPANGVMLSALTQIVGTAYDWAGIGGVELSLQAVPGGNYWDGVGFNTPTRGFVPATSTASWTLPMAMAWPDTTQFEIVARSTDSLGNYSASYSTVTIQFDTTPPTAGVTAPAPNSGLHALGDLAGTAADATAGVGAVEVRLRRNTDGLWWNWAGETWTNVAVSSVANGTANWTLAPTPGLKAYLTNQTSYFVAARAVDRAIPGNAGDFSANGSTFTFIDDTAPSAITDLASSSSTVSGHVQLLWTAPGDDGAAGNILFGAFLVGYSTSSLATFSTTTAQMYVATASVVSGSRRGVDVTNLVAGTMYYLRVWTVDDAGNWSGLSDGATMQAGPALANQIGGRVVKVSSEGITAVEIDCYDVNGALISSTFTVADGLGSFTLGSVPAGTFRVQAIWTADGLGSSVWQDNIQQGTSNLDFVLNLNYTLSTLTGTLGALAAQARFGAAPAFAPRAGGAPAAGGKVELFAQGKRAVEVSPDPTGRWTIPNLLPGKYGVRAFNGVTYTDIVEVALGEGELMEVGFVYNALPEQSVFAFPNPARSGTTFRFESPLTPIEAQVMVFDLGGQLVREIAGSEMTAAGPGLYHAPWGLRNMRGEPVASGVYLFTVKVKGGSGSQTARVTKKLAVVK